MYDKDRYIPVPKYSCTIWEGGFPVLFTSLYCTRKAAVDWNTADSVREKCDWVLSSPWMAFGGKPSVVLQRRQQSKNPCHRGDIMRCNIHQGQVDKWVIQKLNARTHASSQKRKDFNRLLSSHCFPIQQVLNVCRSRFSSFFPLYVEMESTTQFHATVSVLKIRTVVCNQNVSSWNYPLIWRF